MTGSTEREKHRSVTDLGRVGAVHDGNQWIIWGRGGTYDSEPEDDLDCLLLFSARSLSPWVRPFRSSSSLYCRSRQKAERSQRGEAGTQLEQCWGGRCRGRGGMLTSSISCFLDGLFLLLPLMLMSSTPDRILVTPALPFSHSFCIFSRKTCPSAHRLFCFLIPAKQQNNWLSFHASHSVLSM